MKNYVISMHRNSTTPANILQQMRFCFSKLAKQQLKLSTIKISNLQLIVFELKKKYYESDRSAKYFGSIPNEVELSQKRRRS